MLNNTKSIQLTHTTSELRNLVEEYITQQKTGFTFKGVCSYITYWAMEEGKTENVSNGGYESNDIQTSDEERVKTALDTIIQDGRITASGNTYYIVMDSFVGKKEMNRDSLTCESFLSKN